MATSIGNSMVKAFTVFWQWSVPHKSSHRPDDKVYSAVWGISLDEACILRILELSFPDIPRPELPTTELEIRHLVRERMPPTKLFLPGEKENYTVKARERGDAPPLSRDEMQLLELTEEAWTHLPIDLRYLLAASNAHHLEKKLNAMLQDNFHPAAGRKSIQRSLRGISKAFDMWRTGYRAAISRRERYFVSFFFVFLAFSAIYPDVAAGFLNERSYNQRSIGMRIVTLWQLYYLWTFPYHCCWLLFNWSLERLLGALVGNTVYALAAMIPAVHAAYLQSWFRAMMLVMSMSWQLGIQFYAPARDCVTRLLTRRQMSALCQREEADDIDWDSAGKSISNELTTYKSFVSLRPDRGQGPCSWQDVPMRVRTERFIQFTSCFRLGRSADHLVGLIKDDLEGIINTYEDYKLTVLRNDKSTTPDNGHVEPTLPKFLLVFFDIAIFAFVSYSFYPQPFTFNTVVAYGTVVTIKQTIVAFKRYQTPKSASRIFTNMAAVNIIGVLLVSTPVTIDPQVLEDTGRFVALTLAMTFATLFLAEPIAPLLLSGTGMMIAAGNKVFRLSESSRPARAETTYDCDFNAIGEEQGEKTAKQS